MHANQDTILTLTNIMGGTCYIAAFRLDILIAMFFQFAFLYIRPFAHTALELLLFILGRFWLYRDQIRILAVSCLE